MMVFPAFCWNFAGAMRGSICVLSGLWFVLAGGSLLAVVHGKMLLWIFEKEKIL